MYILRFSLLQASGEWIIAGQEWKQGDVWVAVTDNQAEGDRGLAPSGDNGEKFKDLRCTLEGELARLFWRLLCQL